jgi:4-diphosphocytidyl-2-C-methyl-D-erythritol kinase
VVAVNIQNKLPILGGLGAGSANAAAALIGLERELAGVCPERRLSDAARLEIAAEVGSDVPLFLVGGAVLGTNRGERVEGVADLTLDGASEIHAVIALPKAGVSTPQAFRDWDARLAECVRGTPKDSLVPATLHLPAACTTLKKLSRTYASVLRSESKIEFKSAKSGASGIVPTFGTSSVLSEGCSPEKQQGIPRRQQDTQGEVEIDLAENTLLALVRTGIENDFETVVFLQHPPLREIKRQLMGLDSGQPALIAALSGSGSALFGLYRSGADAQAAQQRVRKVGVEAVVTKTLPRTRYWKDMFAK